MKKIRSRAFLLTAIALVCGCGGPDIGEPQEIGGLVTQAGSPMPGAQVYFVAEGGLPAEYRSHSTKTDEAGKYELTDVYPAKYSITVTPGSALAAAPTAPGAEEDPGMMPAGPTPGEADAEQPGALPPGPHAVIDVKPGQDQYDVNI